MSDVPTDVIKFEILRESKESEAIALLTSKLLNSTNLSIYGAFDASPSALSEIEKLYHDISKDGFSVIAIDKRNNKIIAVSFNKYHKRSIPEEDLYVGSSISCQNAWLKNFMNTMIKLELIVDHYNMFQEPCYIQMIATATLLKYEHGNLPDLLVKGTLHALFEKINNLEMHGVSTHSTHTGFRRIPYIPVSLTAMAINDNEREYFSGLGFLEAEQISYQQLNMNISSIPENLSPTFRYVGFYCGNIKIFNEPNTSNTIIITCKRV